MINLKFLMRITLGLGFVLILASVLDFLALHDIKKDYVSGEMLASLKISTSGLPTYTQTPLEWMMISFNYYSRILFLILNSIVLILGINHLRNNHLVKASS